MPLTDAVDVDGAVDPDAVTAAAAFPVSVLGPPQADRRRPLTNAPAIKGLFCMDCLQGLFSVAPDRSCLKEAFLDVCTYVLLKQ
jgi:hypothetical protein